MPPQKKIPEKKKPVAPSLEMRLTEIERKVDFIFDRIAQKAAEQLQEQVAMQIKEQLTKGITDGPSAGNNPSPQEPGGE